MSLDTVFDVVKKEANTSVGEPPAIVPPAVDFRQDQNEDYLLSRSTYRELIRKGNDAVVEIKKLADALESPRAYEVLATMMKQVMDSTDKLMDLQKKNKELYDLEGKTKVEETGKIMVDKAVFVGTSNEILEHFREKTLNGSPE